MKYFFTVVLFSLSMISNAQTDSSELEMDSITIVFEQLPDSTQTGIPFGKLVNEQIGSPGGNIKSEDGKLELIFPAGALEKSTTISIQPVRYSIANTSGMGYQFEPSGIQFLKPIELIYHYSIEEAESCPPELMFMAVQDHVGKWEYLNYSGLDSTAKELRGSIQHFSGVINGKQWELNPLEKTVKMGESFDLHLNIVTPPSAEDEDDLPPLPGKNDFGSNKKFVWTVEGGSKFGKVVKKSSFPGSAHYTTPNLLPPHNTKIELKVDTSFIRVVRQVTRHRKSGGKWNGTTRVPIRENIARFTCKVNLYDLYKITILKKGPSILECSAELEDESSFDVKVFPDTRPRFENQTNSAPTLTKQANCSGVRGGKGGLNYPLKYDPGGCLGPVHVDTSRLTGYGSFGDEMTIEFAPKMVKVMNSKGKFPEEINESVRTLEDVNIGNKIKFRVNRKRQEYDRPGPTNLPEHSFKLIVDPI